MSTVNCALFGAERKWPNLAGNRAISALQSGAFVDGAKFQEMVRARLRERTPNLSALANFLKTSPSTIQKKFREFGTGLSVDFLHDCSPFYQMSVSEMTALSNSAWQEVKPDEAQLLTHFRQLTYTQRQGLLAVLEGRIAQPAKSRRAKWGRAELTEEQQLLVDLYAQSEPQAREGVLKILRGTARKSVMTGTMSYSVFADGGIVTVTGTTTLTR